MHIAWACDIFIPFGSPVVPEVKIVYAARSLSATIWFGESGAQLFISLTVFVRKQRIGRAERNDRFGSNVGLVGTNGDVDCSCSKGSQRRGCSEHEVRRVHNY